MISSTDQRAVDQFEACGWEKSDNLPDPSPCDVAPPFRAGSCSLPPLLCNTSRRLGLWCEVHYNRSMMLDPSRTVTVQIRLTEAEKDGFVQAADPVGLPLSSWVRERLRLTAIREREGVRQSVPFINPIALERDDV